MNIIESIMKNSDSYKSGNVIIPKGLMLHSVGCPQPSAMVFIKQWDVPKAGKSIHGFIQANGDVYKTLPWNPCAKAGHAGSPANGLYMGFEMCEPATIKYTGGANWVDLDPEKTKLHVLGTYYTAVELFASLCIEKNLDPLADGVILSHHEGAVRGVATNHGDPEHLWSRFGLTMDQFRKDVTSKMAETKNKPSDYAAEAWNKAVAMKLFDGTNPQQPLTREQLAVVLFRLGVVK